MVEQTLALDIGHQVRIERDETRYPSKGTWPEFRGRTSIIVEINVDRKRPHLTEYGVLFAKTLHRHGVTWFKDYELFTLAPQRHAEPGYGIPEGKDTRYDLKGAA